MKNILAMGCLFTLMSGCVAPAAPGFDPPPGNGVSITAHYEGSFGDDWVGCGPKTLEGGSCSARGGEIVTSELSATPSTGAAWHCRVKPDGSKGADMTIVVNCR